MRRSGEKNLVIMGTAMTAFVLFALAGALFYFLNEKDFFSETVRARRCRQHRILIAAAKVELAEELALPLSSTVLPQQVVDVLDGGWRTLACPSGGIYALGSVTSRPVCSAHGDGP